VSATTPQPGDRRTPAQKEGAEDLKRGGRKLLLAFVVLVIVVAIAVGLSNCGGDDDPSGGGEQGMAPAGTLELAPAAS
jgi:hypothetical protein